MFGYISPHQNELKVCELQQYRAYYCGLCKAVKKNYGESARMTLNYDCVFLAMLLSGIEEASLIYMGRCGYKLYVKKRPIAPYSEALSYAADLQVLLVYHKLADDKRDEKSLKAALGSVALYASFKRALKRRAALSKIIQEGLAELSALEKQNCAELDAPADAFARMMSETLRLAPGLDSENERLFSKLGYNLGKWVYLADAWDDREKDEKTRSYNPFLASGAGEERASFLLHYCLNEAVNAYDLIDIKSNKGVLDNILYEGCFLKTRRLLGGKDEQSL